ncbi:MAG: hypothetical protein J5669_08400 [Bacteroidales bacterium]|nr:hypothetical protein [Bacteroidales bacterium]
MKRQFVLAALAVLMSVPVLEAKPMNRGLGNPKHTYIPQGTVALGVAGGFNRYNATGESATTGGTLASLITDINGNASLASASASLSWFVANNMALGVRLGYNYTAMDLNNANVLGKLNFQNKHVTNHTVNASLTFRGYIPLFNSKVVALFGEFRATGGYGLGKDYANTDQGKAGSYSDIYTATLGLYPGVSVFVTNFLALELSLPLVEGGYEWNRQTKGSSHESELSHAFANFKPSLVGLNFGLVFHF